MKTLAGILIGGQSSRMGRPKPLIQLAGQTLLERTIAVAREVCDDVCLLGVPTFPLPQSAATVNVLPDTPPDIGPMGGLAALLRAAGRDPAVLLACDLPRLDAGLLHQLLDALDCSIDAVAFKSPSHPNRLEPCCAAFMPSASPTVESHIQSQQYSLLTLLHALRVASIPLSTDDAPKLANMNTPADVPADDLL